MTAKKDAETKTTVRVNGGEEMPLDDLTPEKLYGFRKAYVFHLHQK